MSVPGSHPQPQPKPQAKPTTPAQAGEPQDLKVVQHSQLFYWWPVWATGFILFLISYFQGHHMAVLPSDTQIERTSDKSYTLKVNGEPPGNTLAPNEHTQIDTRGKTPFPLHMTTIKGLGVLWAAVLIVVILITNVPLRGMWSVVIIVALVMLIIIVTVAQVWDPIINAVEFLDIRINAGGYLAMSLALFIIWALAVFLFDRQIYIMFVPGMMKVRDTIGGGETAYDTTGMMVEHLRDDPFRHWILGLGSGDLVVHPSGPQSREIRLNNVLFVGRKMEAIEKLKTLKPVTGE
jgi:hypothetical protein